MQSQPLRDEEEALSVVAQRDRLTTKYVGGWQGILPRI
jgi:hypothetical protein